MPPVAISLKLSRKAFRTKQLFNAFQLFLCIYNIRIYLSEYDCQLPRFWVARLTFDTLPLPLNALPRLRALHYLRLTLSWLPPTRIHIQRITISLPPYQRSSQSSFCFVSLSSLFVCACRVLVRTAKQLHCDHNLMLCISSTW